MSENTCVRCDGTGKNSGGRRCGRCGGNGREVPPVEGSQSELRRAMEAAILERDEMRRANVTPEDATRPLGQSVEYWQDRALDYATAMDNWRIRAIQAEAEGERLRAANERLRDAFATLLEEARDMRSYVPEYFAAKWKHDVALSNAQAVLAALGGSQAKGSE